VLSSTFTKSTMRSTKSTARHLGRLCRLDWRQKVEVDFVASVHETYSDFYTYTHLSLKHLPPGEWTVCVESWRSWMAWFKRGKTTTSSCFSLVSLSPVATSSTAGKWNYSAAMRSVGEFCNNTSFTSIFTPTDGFVLVDIKMIIPSPSAANSLDKTVFFSCVRFY